MTLLEQFPPELIYLILEIGALDTTDALSLRQACKYLYAVAKNHQYWLCVATTLATQRPLPLPSTHALTALSADRLREICIRHERVSSNLASTNPVPRRCKILQLTGVRADVKVTNYLLVHGGQHAIIIFENGKIQIWDMTQKIPKKATFSSECNRILGETRRLDKVGRLLRSHETRLKPRDCDFQELQDERVVLFIASELSLRTQQSSLSIYEISLNKATISEIDKTTLPPPKPLVLSVSIRDPLAIALWDQEDHLYIEAIDYRQNKKRRIDTTLSQKRNIIDMLQCEDGSVIFLSALAKAMDLLIYSNPFNLNEIPPEPTPIPPDINISVEYEDSSAWVDTDHWLTFHKANPYRTPKVAVFGMSQGLSDRSNMVVTVELLDVEDVLQRARGSPSNMTLPLRQRNAQRLKKPPSASPGGGAPLRTSSLGFFSCWQEADALGQPLRFRLLSLRSSDGMGYDRSAHERTLDLPIGLKFISQILDFVEERGALHLLLDGGCSGGCCTRSIHIFEY